MHGFRHPLEAEVQQLADGSEVGSKEMAIQNASGFDLQQLDLLVWERLWEKQV